MKLSAFIANSSSRTGINNHFCKENNITDLSNKHLAQNNFSFLIGSAIGLGISTCISMKFAQVFPVLLFLSIFHFVYAQISCQQIFLSDMNPQRAFYISMNYIKNEILLDPRTVNQKEKLLFSKLNFLKFCSYPLENIIKREKNNLFMDQVLLLFKDHKFLAYVDPHKTLIMRRNKHKVYTFVRVDAESIDIFLAFLFSIRLHESIKNRKFTDDKLLSNIKENLEWVTKIDKKHLAHQLKEKGWDSNFHLLEEKYMRYQMLFKN